MEITENKNNFNGKITYSITISINDNIDAFEIAECFKKQFPKKACSISFGKVKEMEFGIILLGLNLPTTNKNVN